MSTWKKYGGLNKIESLNNATMYSLVVNKLTLREAYLGDFDVQGRIHVRDNLLCDNDINAQSITANQNITAVNMYSTGLGTFNNIQVNGSLNISQNMGISNDTSIHGNLTVSKYLYIGNTFLVDASDSNIPKLGINTNTPTATVDIHGRDQVLNLTSTTSDAILTLTQEAGNNMRIYADVSDSGIIFGMTDNSGGIRYTSAGSLVLDAPNINITELVVGDQPINAVETTTATVYANGNKPFYNADTILSAPSLSLSSTDASSNAALYITAQNKKGIAIHGGVFPNDTSRAVGVIEMNNTARDAPIYMVEGTSNLKHKTTVGINTFLPETDDYVLDINGPTKIKNGDITLLNSETFTITSIFTRGNRSLYVGGKYDISNIDGFDYYLHKTVSTVNGAETWSEYIFPYDDTINQFSDSMFKFAYIYDNSYALIGGSDGNPDGENYALYEILEDGTYNAIVLETGTGTDESITTINSAYIDENRRMYLAIPGSLIYLDPVNGQYKTYSSVGIAGQDTILRLSSSGGSSLYGISNTKIYIYDIDVSPPTQSSAISFSGKTFRSIHNNGNQVVVVGNQCIFYSLNGGVSWAQIAGITDIMNDVCIIDAQNAIAVGNEGVIYVSKNGLQTWTKLTTNDIKYSGNANQLLSSTWHLTHVDIYDKTQFLITRRPASGITDKTDVFHCYLPGIFNNADNYVLEVDGSTHTTGDYSIDGKIWTTSRDFRLLNEHAANIHIGGDATSIIIGNAATGNTVVQHSLIVGKNATVGNNMAVSGNIDIAQNADIRMDTRIRGNARIDQTLTANSLVIGNNTTVGGNVNIASELTVGGNSSIGGDIAVGGTATIGGNVNISNNISVGGTTNLIGNTTAGNISASKIVASSSITVFNENSHVLEPTGVIRSRIYDSPAGYSINIGTADSGNKTIRIGSLDTDASCSILIGSTNDTVVFKGNIVSESTTKFGSALYINNSASQTSAGAGIYIFDEAQSKPGKFVISDDKNGYIFCSTSANGINNAIKLNTGAMKLTQNMDNAIITLAQTNVSDIDSSYTIGVSSIDLSNILVRNKANSTTEKQYIDTAIAIGKTITTTIPNTALDIAGNAILAKLGVGTVAPLSTAALDVSGQINQTGSTTITNQFVSTRVTGLLTVAGNVNISGDSSSYIIANAASLTATIPSIEVRSSSLIRANIVSCSILDASNNGISISSGNVTIAGNAIRATGTTSANIVAPAVNITGNTIIGTAQNSFVCGASSVSFLGNVISGNSIIANSIAASRIAGGLPFLRVDGGNIVGAVNITGPLRSTGTNGGTGLYIAGGIQTVDNNQRIDFGTNAPYMRGDNIVAGSIPQAAISGGGSGGGTTGDGAFLTQNGTQTITGKNTYTGNVVIFNSGIEVRGGNIIASELMTIDFGPNAPIMSGSLIEGGSIPQTAINGYNGNLLFAGTNDTIPGIKTFTNPIILYKGIDASYASQTINFGNNAPIMRGTNIATASIPLTAINDYVMTLSSVDTVTGDKTFNGKVIIRGTIDASSVQAINFGTNAPIMSGTNIATATIPLGSINANIMTLSSTDNITGAKTFNALTTAKGGIDASFAQTIQFGTNAPIMYGNNIAARTIPLGSINDNIMTLSSTDNITGAKTFNGQTVLKGGIDASSTQVIQFGTNAPIMSGTNIGTRTISTASINANLVTLEGADSITGSKTFSGTTQTFNSKIVANGGIEATGAQFINFGSNAPAMSGGNIAAATIPQGSIVGSGNLSLLNGAQTYSALKTYTGGITASATQTINFGTNAPTMYGNNIATATIPIGSINASIATVDTTQTITGTKTFAGTSAHSFTAGLTISGNITATSAQTINLGTNAPTMSGTNIATRTIPIGSINANIATMDTTQTITGTKIFAGASAHSFTAGLTTTGGIDATATQTVSFGTNAPTMYGNNIATRTIPLAAINANVALVDQPQTIAGTSTFSGGIIATAQQTINFGSNTPTMYGNNIATATIPIGSINASLVTTNDAQTITGTKTFGGASAHIFNSGLTIKGGITATDSQIISFGSNGPVMSGGNISIGTIPLASITNNANICLLNTIQTFTAAKTFSSGITSTGGITASAVQTIDFGTNAPTMRGTNISGNTVPLASIVDSSNICLLNSAQTFTATKTFSAGLTVTGGTITVPNASISANAIIGGVASSVPGVGSVGTVSINKTTAATAGYALDVNGAVLATTYNANSDRRLKTNIRTMTSQLSNIERLQPSVYEWQNTEKTDYGFIAQDVYTVFPHMRPNIYSGNAADEPVDESGNPIYYSLDYGRMTPYLWRGIQELIGEVRVLKRENAEIRARLAKLEQR